MKIPERVVSKNKDSKFVDTSFFNQNIFSFLPLKVEEIIMKTNGFASLSDDEN